MWKTISEAAVVLVAGIALALLANALSPRGLSLTRNYFPEVPMVPAELEAVDAADPQTEEPVSGNEMVGDAAEAAALTVLKTRLRQRGLEWIELEEARAWFEDPRYAMELVILVDARTRRHYRDGHVPGAYLLDHFRPEETLAELLPAALAAEQVIVYCNGGDCDDSEFAAVFLRDAGVPGDRIRVYTGGLEEWREAGLPIELGQRGSGIHE